jgi:cyclophilin family peptidyl-prolyl cis-trans isomerase
MNNTVMVITDYGTMEIVLYDSTPLHRDNFMELVEEGFYNDLLFHRVIQ